MPRKLGQHFLHNRGLLRRIAEASLPGQPEPVLEIGPGRGALTEFLLPRASRVTAIEIDDQLVGPLRERFASAANLDVIQADILDSDLSRWMPAVVAGNLPYYITSPILEKVLALGPNLVRAVFLIQKEVADRLTAAPGSRDFGYLTVQTQLLCRPRRLFNVPPSAFRPPPQVDSAVVLLEPRTPPVEDAGDFLRFASRCFRQKRKTLRGNLKASYPAIDGDPAHRLRAEQLSLDDLIALYRRLV